MFQKHEVFLAVGELWKLHALTSLCSNRIRYRICTIDRDSLKKMSIMNETFNKVTRYSYFLKSGRILRKWHMVYPKHIFYSSAYWLSNSYEKLVNLSLKSSTSIRPKNIRAKSSRYSAPHGNNSWCQLTHKIRLPISGFFRME